MNSSVEFPDPRSWPAASAGPPWPDVRAALDAPTRDEAEAHDASVLAWLRARFDAGEGDALARAFAQAPSFASVRHLQRLAVEAERAYAAADVLRVVLFALPIVIVTASDEGHAPVTLSGVLGETEPVADHLRAARAFGGAETLALARALVDAHALGWQALPGLLARGRLGEGDDASEHPPLALELAPSPIRVDVRDERVHVRFIVGAILAPPRADPLAGATLGREGVPLARAIGDALKAPGVSLLALPRPPQPVSLAVLTGRTAQRDVAAQLFVSNAIRTLRRAYGEPTAIISAHRAADAPGGGELRLSLSSPFAPKAAEGFRCPIEPGERVQDAAAMLEALLSDCQVTDVRVRPGIHDDVDP
ncbi:MAG TPA: hypothetical protein VGL67_01365, partial [Casimicrobiaceae bacterium]